MLVPAILLNLMVGSHLGIIETTYQPMKIAAAEAQWETCQPCSFSLFQIGGGRNDETPTQIIEIPHLLSILATGTWDGQVVGLNELQSQYEQQYGPGNYVPNVFIQYWAHAGDGLPRPASCSSSPCGGLADPPRQAAQLPAGSCWAATWLVVTPFLINTAGWLLTESGRQPWIVQGLMTTTNGVSPSVSTHGDLDQPVDLHRSCTGSSPSSRASSCSATPAGTWATRRLRRRPAAPTRTAATDELVAALTY